MNNTDLLIKLRDLHEQLTGINIDLGPEEHINEETVDTLGDLVTDIGKLVDQAKQATQPEEISDDIHGLQTRILEFDRTHPRVSQFLSRTTDLLGMLGI